MDPNPTLIEELYMNNFHHWFLYINFDKFSHSCFWMEGRTLISVIDLLILALLNIIFGSCCFLNCLLDGLHQILYIVLVHSRNGESPISQHVHMMLVHQGLALLHVQPRECEHAPLLYDRLPIPRHFCLLQFIFQKLPHPITTISCLFYFGLPFPSQFIISQQFGNNNGAWEWRVEISFFHNKSALILGYESWERIFLAVSESLATVCRAPVLVPYRAMLFAKEWATKTWKPSSAKYLMAQASS